MLYPCLLIVLKYKNVIFKKYYYNNNIYFNNKFCIIIIRQFGYSYDKQNKPHSTSDK